MPSILLIIHESSSNPHHNRWTLWTVLYLLEQNVKWSTSKISAQPCMLFVTIFLKSKICISLANKAPYQFQYLNISRFCSNKLKRSRWQFNQMWEQFPVFITRGREGKQERRMMKSCNTVAFTASNCTIMMTSGGSVGWLYFWVYQHNW